MQAPEFLDVQQVILIHRTVIVAVGGTTFDLVNPSLLESAVMTPQVSYDGAFLHEDLGHMAAAYAFHIAENQPFLDGNKRTGAISALTFLDANGVLLPYETANDVLYDSLIDIAHHRMSKADLADVIRWLKVSYGLAPLGTPLEPRPLRPLPGAPPFCRGGARG